MSPKPDAWKCPKCGRLYALIFRLVGCVVCDRDKIRGAD